MALKIQNVTKSFNDKIILKDFSAEFPEKGLFAVVGESGIGKTTFLRIIAGLDDEYDGKVVGGGVKNVSFAFQEYRLFEELTALENATCAFSGTKNEADEKMASELLCKMGLSAEDINLYPSELSGGMKHRVSLCRAFMKRSPILLLDEPTKELDEENAGKILEIIGEISKEKLVIFVTHSMKNIEALSATVLQIPKI